MIKRSGVFLCGIVLCGLLASPAVSEEGFTYYTVSYENQRPNVLYLTGTNTDLKDHVKDLRETLQYISYKEKIIITKTETVMTMHADNFYTSVLLVYGKPFQSENDVPQLPPLPTEPNP